MNDTSKMIGENGTVFIDGTSSGHFYQLYVASDTIFTVLEEKDKSSDTADDVMSDQNLETKTVPAGAIITPRKEEFSRVGISSGSLIGYNS